MSQAISSQFPADRFPRQPAHQRLLGLYPQRQVHLQRVKIPGGRLTPQQLMALADTARELSVDDVLHLTTRQGIELRGLLEELVPEAQARIAETGLTTLAAAGNTVRNSTVDPLGGLRPGAFDLMPLAIAIDDALASVEGVWWLPRKFKISLSGDAQGRMKPWMSDLGIVATGEGEYSAIVAGSLGAKPASGVLFAESLSADDCISLAVACVRMHGAESDREHRNRARLRHVREKMGDEAFLERLTAYWQIERPRHQHKAPSIPAPPSIEDSVEMVRLAVPGGDLPLDLAAELARVVSSQGGEVRLGVEHDLYLFGLDVETLPPRLLEWRSDARIVACPGIAVCTKAAGATQEAFEALQGLAEANPHLLFAISGCPNSCSHACAAGLGVVSRLKRDGYIRRPVFRIMVGGEAGSGPELGKAGARDVELADLERVARELLAAQGLIRETSEHDDEPS